ncbi:MAG: hypothetical protein LC780_11410 [Acidobacteria bacterium]|nr:hypothetical protein [Acidobacteriota bacterium]
MYQLKKCPRWRSSFSSVAKAFWSLSPIWRLPIHSKSAAAAVERRPRPMLVGDVRRATTGAGIS